MNQTAISADFEPTNSFCYRLARYEVLPQILQEPAVQSGQPFPIKIGKTTNEVEQRVQLQCRSSAVFEKPIILGQWEVDQVGSFESAVHAILKVRGKWRSNAPGQEWFDTTTQEIQAIVDAVRGH